MGEGGAAVLDSYRYDSPVGRVTSEPFMNHRGAECRVAGQVVALLSVALLVKVL